MNRKSVHTAPTECWLIGGMLAGNLAMIPEGEHTWCIPAPAGAIVTITRSDSGIPSAPPAPEIFYEVGRDAEWGMRVFQIG